MDWQQRQAPALHDKQSWPLHSYQERTISVQPQGAHNFLSYDDVRGSVDDEQIRRRGYTQEPAIHPSHKNRHPSDLSLSLDGTVSSPNLPVRPLLTDDSMSQSTLGLDSPRSVPEFPPPMLRVSHGPNPALRGWTRTRRPTS